MKIEAMIVYVAFNHLLKPQPMRDKIRVAPSILSADFSRLKDEIASIEKGKADMVHIDIMDGHFVPNITIGAPVVKSLNNVTDLLLDVHLMIENPENYIDDFSKAGADMISVHIEATDHLHRLIQLIKANNVLAGVALNPSTPIGWLEEVISDLDFIVIMSVNPGFGGQKYIPQSTEKVRRLRAMIDEYGLDIDIQVDGGVNDVNAKDLADAGADILVAGSFVFGSDDRPGAIKSIAG